MTGLSSLSLWIIISVIGGITIVAVGLVVAILCYRKCSKKQQPSHQNVYVPLCTHTHTHAHLTTLGQDYPGELVAEI